MDDKKPDTPSNPDENTETYPKLPSPVIARSYHALNGSTITSPQIASLRLKPTKSTDSLTNHPLQNFDEEESDVFSTWSSQLSRRSPSTSSTSSSSSLQPKFSPVPVDSVGGLMLTKLREMNTVNADFSSIVQMLIAKKATLLLPASAIMPFEQVDLTLLEDHVLVSQPSDDGHKIITLSGVTGFIQQDTLKTIGLVPPEPPISTYIKENSKTRKSIFDSILKPADLPYDCPSIKVINKDVDILLQGMTIQTIVIESSLRVKEVEERIATLETSKEIELKVESVDLPDLPENVLKEVNGFTGEYIKLPLQDEVTSGDKIQGFFDTDDALGSKIAALNFYKLGLSHLGVDVNPQQEHIDIAIQTAGKELQNLDQVKAPYEKLNIIIRCHRIVVDALEKKSQNSPKNEPNGIKTTVQDASENASEDVPEDAPKDAPEDAPKDAPEDAPKDAPEDIPVVPLSQTPDSSVPIPPPVSPMSPTQTAPKSPTSPTSPSEEKTNKSNADAIFPLLIFIVVKSNPKKLISNLRFMQRYRIRSLLHGEASYCLTNLLAIVEFLGKMDLNDFGLQSDKPLSIANEQIPSTSTIPTVIEHRVSRRVGQEIVGVADSGLKVITGVVDTSYKMIGRVLGYKENSTANSTSPSAADIGKEHNLIPNTTNSTEDINTEPSAKIIEKELAEISSDKHDTEKNSQIDEPKSLTERLIPFNILTRFSSDRVHAEEENKKENEENKENKGMINQHNKIAPPIKRFLDCSDDEFRAKDVPELLSDYKRLSAAIQELGLFSS
ncbi:27359_t:CDS:10 [Dentiscutata erythropus]|uniref:27359_t:CDS:1 n=1 Tax=Dentiscutata erythropus TaxID=1348616 RepID=A0A9N9IM65_9GLOM|nr:27359_t:CDS:10 [Dentiscutata erythropus]